MAGKSPEKPAHEEKPASAEPPTARAPKVEEPTSIPPVPLISPLLARRLGARVLDPETAFLAPGQPLPMPTVYVGDTLVVRDIDDPFVNSGGRDSRVKELIAYAKRQPEPLVLEPVGEPLLVPHRGERASLNRDAKVTVTRMRLVRDPEKAGKAPDVWRFVQGALMEPSERGSLLYDKLGLGRLPAPDSEPDKAEKARRDRRDRRGASMASGVSVEHVLTAGGGVWGGAGGVWGGAGGVWGGAGGVWGGAGGVWGGAGGAVAEYGTPGVGGRTPVVWSAPDPRGGVTVPEHPPVVAVLDTGLGKHPWFPAEPEGATAESCTGKCPGAHRKVTFENREIGVWKEPSRDPENTGVIIDDVNGLVDQLCGHGTFISGIIRQRCPEAVILEVPIMASDGAALEHDIVAALGLLLDRHRAAKSAIAENREEDVIKHGVLDVVNLSLGFYHETPDEADDAALHDLLQDFADEGVVVVACAGNDSTRAKFFPAAFAAQGRDGLVGVGATNPDDRSIALFSNVGDWVTAHAPGAGIVSTVPTTLSGSLNPPITVEGFGPGTRAGIDFDDFRSGFAVWSGTSFASPWIAGEIAAEIVKQGSRQSSGAGPSRARRASTAVVAKANADRFEETEK
ncbi:MAG: S8 family serine peptidase [Ornithinibacter sp.]